MTDDTMISVMPTEYAIHLRHLKRDRTPERIIFTMRRWHERWVSQRPNLVFSYPQIYCEHDPSMDRPLAHVFWTAAILPEGRGRFALATGAGVDWNNINVR